MDSSLFSLLAAGKYGSEIRPAFWLNFLFLLMPVWGAVTLFSKPKDRPLIGGYNVSLKRRRSPPRRGVGRGLERPPPSTHCLHTVFNQGVIRHSPVERATERER